MLLEINKLIGEDCQLWVTTHSIGFLRALQDELKDDCQIIQFEDGLNLASEAQVLIPMKKTVSTWRKIFEIALDNLVHLVCPKQLIYCEGKDKPGQNGQEKGFDAMVFNNIFTEKYHETLFVSSGGNSEPDQRSEIAFAICQRYFPAFRYSS